MSNYSKAIFHSESALLNLFHCGVKSEYREHGGNAQFQKLFHQNRRDSLSKFNYVPRTFRVTLWFSVYILVLHNRVQVMIDWNFSNTSTTSMAMLIEGKKFVNLKKDKIQNAMGAE